MGIPLYEKLIKMPMDEVIKRYNEEATYTQVGPGFWLDEIIRREQRKYNKILKNYTRWTMILTAVITLAVIFDIVFHIYFY